MGIGRYQLSEIATRVVAVVGVLGPYTVKHVLPADHLPQIRAVLGRHHLQPFRRIGRRLHPPVLPPSWATRSMIGTVHEMETNA